MRLHNPSYDCVTASRIYLLVTKSFALNEVIEGKGKGT
jgi:hypothetical protein